MVDAQDLKSCFRKKVRVRFPPAALFFSGRSPVGLRRLLWEQEIPSSNLGAPTSYGNKGRRNPNFLPRHDHSEVWGVNLGAPNEALGFVIDNF